MEQSFEQNDTLRRNKLSVKERLQTLEYLVHAALMPQNTDEEKEHVQVIRDQSCYTLYGKSWKEAKEIALKEIKHKLPKKL